MIDRHTDNRKTPEGHHEERGVRRETRQDHGLDQPKWGTEKGLRRDLEALKEGRG
jgi:hypothetical protein